jgi:uncharacterized protein DUF6338
MPTTLTGLLVFLALLLPGFVYTAIVRRGRPEYRTTALHEIAAVALASVLSELVVLIGFAAVDGLRPSWTPDMRALITQPAAYLAEHYLTVFGWATGLLFAAGVVAAAAAAFTVWKLPVHRSLVSSWWTLFKDWHPDTTRTVQCELDDGSYVEGILADWNSQAEDSPDRDVLLVAPILYRPVGSVDYRQHPVSAVCVAARNIRTMFVTYSDDVTSASSAAEAVGEVAASAAEQGSAPAPG